LVSATSAQTSGAGAAMRRSTTTALSASAMRAWSRVRGAAVEPDAPWPSRKGRACVRSAARCGQRPARQGLLGRRRGLDPRSTRAGAASRELARRSQPGLSPGPALLPWAMVPGAAPSRRRNHERARESSCRPRRGTAPLLPRPRPRSVEVAPRVPTNRARGGHRSWCRPSP
jgi:hypothetical protein